MPSDITCRGGAKWRHPGDWEALHCIWPYLCLVLLTECELFCTTFYVEDNNSISRYVLLSMISSESHDLWGIPRIATYVKVSETSTCLSVEQDCILAAGILCSDCIPAGKLIHTYFVDVFLITIFYYLLTLQDFTLTVWTFSLTHIFFDWYLYLHTHQDFSFCMWLLGIFITCYIFILYYLDFTDQLF